MAKIFRATSPLCGEFTGHRWIPLTKVSDAELSCFIWSAPESERLSKHSWYWWFELSPRSLWRHCNDFHHHKGECRACSDAGTTYDGCYDQFQTILPLFVVTDTLIYISRDISAYARYAFIWLSVVDELKYNVMVFSLREVRPLWDVYVSVLREIIINVC